MSEEEMTIEIREHVPLSAHTTIGLGGTARYFTTCETVGQIHEGLDLCVKKNIPLQVIGDGSNLIFSDRGFNGLVMKMALRGVTAEDDGETMEITAQAGENWDDLVKYCITIDCAGIECLSGIPGLVGATPIQNVGAYGQEVSDTIVKLTALDRRSGDVVEFSNAECRFEYRQSRFKSSDFNRYIIVAVTFRLRKNGKPEIRYAELRSHIAPKVDLNALKGGRQALDAVRNAVLALRKGKSMVLDPADPNTRSVGSFFMNPVLSMHQVEHLKNLWLRSGHAGTIPTFTARGGMKLPAAWLVENAGYHKGFRKGRAGVSSNHALALVNFGGTTAELLALADEIQEAVRARFGIVLEREPIVIE